MKINIKRKLPPGTLMYTGSHDTETKITHIMYNKKEVIEKEDIGVIQDEYVDWIVIEGLKNIDVIRDICLGFSVDHLVIEDILNINQRNKIEIFEDYIFSVQKYSYVDNDVIKEDYFSMLLFKDKLITFSEKNNLFIKTISKMLESPSSKIRENDHNYLFYQLLDIIVDEQLVVFSFIKEQVEEIETKLLQLNRENEIILFQLRKELAFIRSNTNQLFDGLFNNSKMQLVVVEKSIKKYFDDLKDHLLNLIDKTHNELELIKSIVDIYNNNMSQKMNTIMTTLTIFSAIFIPLSFIASVFGMNFVDFPILQNDQGLPIFIGICITLPLMMLIFFKVKKWF